MTGQPSADMKEQKDKVRSPVAVISKRGPLSEFELRLENSLFKHTGGVSENNHASGFTPAYRNIRTGEIAISRFANGEPAPVHVLEGLPEEWVIARDAQGYVRRVLATIVSGFLRNGRFYTREAAARVLSVEESV